MKTFLSNSGQVSATTVFQLLDPSSIFDATSFYYDFFIQGDDTGAGGIWQVWDGAAYQDAVGSNGSTATGVSNTEQEWIRGVEIDSASTGLARISRSAGDLNYWYTLSNGAAFPSTRASSGSTTSDVEFFVEPNKTYNFATNGSFEWQYWDGVAWVTFTQGATNGFLANVPASGRIKLSVTSGTVVFSFTSED